MTASSLPTTDLYFLNSFGDRVRRFWRAGPVRRLGANSFSCGDRFLLVRRDTPALMEQALNWPGQLIYLIDDNIESAASSNSLPAGYRERLGQFARNWLDRLFRRTDFLITSCEPLAARFQADPRVRAQVLTLDPLWLYPFADQDHYSGLPGKRLEIAHLGTASHTGALKAITPAAIALLDRYHDSRFTFVATAGLHPDLDTHPRAQRVNPMAWPRYCRWLKRQRFHLALYPLEETAFDGARSANKLIEHAIAGAVGVYPANWRPVGGLDRFSITAPANPAHWEACLMQSVEHRQMLIDKAQCAAAALIRYTNPAKQRHFWSQIFDL
jgi:hypothetical protein